MAAVFCALFGSAASAQNFDTAAAEAITRDWRGGNLNFVARDSSGSSKHFSNAGDSARSYPVASFSKAATGLAVALLIQDGKLTLEHTVGELLAGYFEQRGAKVDPTLAPMTVRRLLTHTAGLRTNFSTDPVNGIDNNKVLYRVWKGDPLEYLLAAEANTSTGDSKFLYSNVSYLLLGLMVETVAAQKYEDFIIERVFRPIKINATMSKKHRDRGLAAFAGWQMTLEEVAVLWDQFDPVRSVLLRPDTIEKLIRTPLAAPTSADGRAHYAFGTYVRANANRTSFILTHTALSNFFREDRRYELLVESRSSGSAFIAAASPELGAEPRRALWRDLRKVIVSGAEE